MKQREAEKLKELRETLARQRENLDEIEKHIDMIERDAKVPVAKKEEGKE
jgi:Mitochondrial ATPase inhibitor, IATP